MYIQSTIDMDYIYQVKISKQSYTSQIITSCRRSHFINKDGEVTLIMRTSFNEKNDEWSDCIRGIWCKTSLTIRLNRESQLKKLGI